MEEGDTDLFAKEEKDSKNKIKEWFSKNWKMISVLLVVIAVGGSIYAYSQKTTIKENIIDESENQETTVTEEETSQETVGEEKITIEESAEASEEITPKENGKVASDQTEALQESQEKPETEEQTGEIFIEKAEAGEGITHLARKALKEYLAKRENNLELTKEHKIYIEDYLQNRIGHEALKLGEERTFSKDSIEKAIKAAQKLNDKQLKNIEQFSTLVPNLT